MRMHAVRTQERPVKNRLLLVSRTGFVAVANNATIGVHGPCMAVWMRACCRGRILCFLMEA